MPELPFTVSVGFHPRCSPLSVRSSKVNFIIGLLRGRALACAQASMSTGLDSLPLDSFISRFQGIFDRPDLAGCAGERLSYALAERQSHKCYASELYAHCGLNDSLRDVLVAATRPRDLAETIDRTIELDNYQQERRRERSSTTLPHALSSRSKGSFYRHLSVAAKRPGSSAEIDDRA